MAETVATTFPSESCAVRILSATLLINSGVAKDDPPYFCTTSDNVIL